MKCANCRVEISCVSSNCPFCGKFLKRSSIEDELKYPNIREVSVIKNNKLLRLSLFAAITSSIILFTINVLTFSTTLWSVVPISAIWLLIPVISLPFAKKKVTPLMIVLDNILICLFLLILDAATGKDEWAMSYVVPFILSGSSFTITIIVLLKKLTWKELYLFQLSIAAICFIPIVARVFFVFVFWPSIVSAVYGLITIIAMLIFSDKQLKFESKKRFHF